MSNRKKPSQKPTILTWRGTFFPFAGNMHLSAGIVLITVITFLAYLPSLSCGFIWDDDSYVTENQIIKAPNGLYRFWLTTEPIDCYPASNTTLWIEWRLWGMNATGYHATNLILHIVESLLIWLILRKLSIRGAFFAALIFAVHPVNVEAVAWIAQRKDMMAMLFFLLSILWYLKAEIPSPGAQNGIYSIDSPPATRSSTPTTRSWPLWYWLSLAAFALAMLSKGSVVILPVLLLTIIWWLRPLTRWDLARTAPFFVIAAILTIVSKMWFQTFYTDVRTAGFAERLLGAGGVIWFYIYKAIWPLNLIFVYPEWTIMPGNPLWWLPLLATLVTTAVLWKYRNINDSWCRPLLFAWVFFCLALAPALGFVDAYFMLYSLTADHYQHIAIIGVITLAAAGWSIWYNRVPEAARLKAVFVAVATTAVLTLLTFRQTLLYSDPVTLYRTTLEQNPNCWMAYNNLGKILFDAGRVEESIEYYQQALRLKPDYSPESYSNLGAALAQTGRPQQALACYDKALKLFPNFADAHNNFGNLLSDMGRIPEAINHYEIALRLKPTYLVHNNLANALSRTGRLPEAIEHYEQALNMNSDYPEAHNNLGVALVRAGRAQEALEHYKKALGLKPDFTEVYYNLALLFGLAHQPSKAVAAAQKAIELAQSQGQTDQANRIEKWLSSYRANLSDSQNPPPSSKPDSPPP